MDKKRIKIFLGLKLKEILLVIGVVLVMGIAIVLVFLITSGLINVIKQFSKSFPIALNIIGYTLAFLVIGFGVFGLVMLVWDWIKSNWKEAGRLSKRGGRL